MIGSCRVRARTQCALPHGVLLQYTVAVDRGVERSAPSSHRVRHECLARRSACTVSHSLGNERGGRNATSSTSQATEAAAAAAAPPFRIVLPLGARRACLSSLFADLLRSRPQRSRAEPVVLAVVAPRVAAMAPL